MAFAREPARFCACSDVYSKENKGFVQRTVTANGESGALLLHGRTLFGLSSTR